MSTPRLRTRSTAELARNRTRNYSNVEVLEGDIASFTYPEPFDIVYCVGVIHHTNQPDATFDNLVRLCKPGGLIIVWCYSLEGNRLVRWIVEPLRKMLLSKLSRQSLLTISKWITALMYVPAHTIYRLSFFRFAPYFEYLGNFRRLSFDRNVLNVFDKLNAPHTDFISRDRIEKWFARDEFASKVIEPYKGVSWRATGILKGSQR